jgi:hypothetical protein
VNKLNPDSDSSTNPYRYKIIVYVPETHIEPVKAALFMAGAGRQGDYDQCCWQTLGEGQFRPLLGSEPFIGKKNTLETVAEYRLELLCAEDVLPAVIEALKAAHPYEEPAYDVFLRHSF